MALKSLSDYDRYILKSACSNILFHTSKGGVVIYPGTVYGVRSSFDGKKIRGILHDDFHKVFTLDPEDVKELVAHSEYYKDQELPQDYPFKPINN
jgi:hypothetical protein